MISNIRILTGFFIFVFLFGHSQLVFSEPSIQINSTAMDGKGVFLPKTIPYLIITDPAGLKVGYDPTIDKKYNEFNAGWTISGSDEIEGFEAMFPPINGTYTIEVIGSSLMAFFIDISIYREIAGEGLPSLEVRGVTDKGITSQFQFTYNSDPSKPAGSAVRIATPSSLKQDIALSRKIGWIDSDGIMMSLYKKAEAIEKSLARDDKNTAKNQLDALINEVNAQKGKHIKDEAIKILLEDAQYLMEHL